MILDKILRLKLINDLINKQKTGRPSQFAKTLKIGERQMYNILDELGLCGLEIAYDDKMKTYQYAGTKRLRITIEFYDLSEEDMDKTNGGMLFPFSRVINQTACCSLL